MLPVAVRHLHFLRQLFCEDADERAGVPYTAGSEAEARDRLNLARGTGETDVFLESADWLLRNAHLSGNEARRLADRLSELGRHADALAVLHRYAKTQRAPYWRRLAVAIAGTDQLAQAGEALERARQLDPEAGQPDPFAEALRLANEEGPRFEQIVAWPAAAALVEAYVVLGVQRRAAEVLAAALARSPPRGDDAIRDALRLAQDIIRLTDPAWAARLMAAVLGWFGAASEPLSADEITTTFPGFQLCQALALQRAGRNEDAVPLLAPLARHAKGKEPKGAEDSRLELAKTVGRLVIAEVNPRFAAGGPRKIIDMFPMNDELLMLKIKLEEMYDWVDHFVIVESVLTFRGEPKPLHFERHKAEFSRFSDKIVHVVVDTMPPWASSPWVREFYQRDCGLRALARLCGQDDLVLVTDVDEIIRRSALETFAGPFAGLGMPYYNYFFNLERIEPRQMRWAGALKARYLQRIGASYAKIGLPQYVRGNFMDDTGWHFSGARDVDGLVSKFTSYSNDKWADVRRGKLEKAVSRVRADGGVSGYVRREIDDRFPAYIGEHRDELSSLIL